MLPSDTQLEKPRSRDAAQSSTVVTIAPDCATKATLPLRGVPTAKEALTPAGGDRTPRQLGPTMRISEGRAANSMSRSSFWPASLPDSAKPAEITIAARVPRSANSAIRPGTVDGGVQRIARSGDTGRLFTFG